MFHSPSYVDQEFIQRYMHSIARFNLADLCMTTTTSTDNRPARELHGLHLTGGDVLQDGLDCPRDDRWFVVPEGGRSGLQADRVGVLVGQRDGGDRSLLLETTRHISPL